MSNDEVRQDDQSVRADRHGSLLVLYLGNLILIVVPWAELAFGWIIDWVKPLLLRKKKFGA